jgi:GNAT superfamily N-acetyltransferase
MTNRISVTVARSFDDIIKCVAIRSAVYIGEQGWTFKEDWDGNDFVGTHMIACVDGDPAGSIRIRYFGDFAKCERLAVLPQYRQRRYGGRGVAFELCDAGINFCLQKGFTKFYGHSLKELVPFWSKIGRGAMKPYPGAEIDCNGKTIIPMYGELPPVPGAISHESGHYVIVRPEGKWDEPGFWEPEAQAQAAQPAPAATPAADVATHAA